MSQFTKLPINRARILAVDDKLDNLELLSMVLSLQGYEVEGCSRGELAIKMAQTSAPDLILLDISMPEMDGFFCLPDS